MHAPTITIDFGSPPPSGHEHTVTVLGPGGDRYVSRESAVSLPAPDGERVTLLLRTLPVPRPEPASAASAAWHQRDARNLTIDPVAMPAPAELRPHVQAPAQTRGVVVEQQTVPYYPSELAAARAAAARQRQREEADWRASQAGELPADEQPQPATAAWPPGAVYLPDRVDPAEPAPTVEEIGADLLDQLVPDVAEIPDLHT